MSEARSVACDHCGADITDTGNMIDYRVLLMSEKLPLRGTTATAMMIYPPIKAPMHFCGIFCLKEKVATL